MAKTNTLLPQDNTGADIDAAQSRFPYNLRAGDEVRWNDPDGGICSRTDRIQLIQYEECEVGELPETATITWPDGSCVECFLTELS